MTAPPPRERPRPPSRGQAEVIGVVLILAMTLVGATVALAFGASGLNEARIGSQQSGVEHAMTQLDSRSAMVALGDSSTQHVPLAATGEGSYHLDADAGWIRVTHTDYDGSGSDEVIYNESLGALVYERDDTQIAYQGGGVWRSQGGNSRMISPPEFHYQSATLTLPVIRLSGSASAGGTGITAEIDQVSSAQRVFPNSTTRYDAGTGPAYHNPVREGNVTVTVQSDYYRAWEDYFRTRTSGEVTVDHAAGTVSVQLISQGIVGDFGMPADGNAIEIRGLGDEHAVTDFNVTLRPDDADSADFSNLQWTLYAEQGGQEFEIHLRDGGSAPDTTPCKDRHIAATVYYSGNGGNPYHGWHNDTAFRTSCDDLDGDGNNETYLHANLSGSTQLTMQELSNSKLNHYSPGNEELTDPINFTEHGSVSWEPREFNTTASGDDDTTIGNLTNHYLSLMGPDVELTVEDKGSNTVNEAASSGLFEQQAGAGKFITFLHITENRVAIELD